MPHPPSPNLEISPRTYKLVENSATKIQLALSTSSPVAFNAGDEICFDFPEAWTIVPVDSSWSYRYDTSNRLGILTSKKKVDFPYTLSLNITSTSQSRSISVFLGDSSGNRITQPTNIDFSFMESGEYLFAYATNSTFYFNGSSSQLEPDNRLSSSLGFTESSNKSYTVGLKIDFYTHDSMGNIRQFGIDNNDQFSITVNGAGATPDATRKTWSVPSFTTTAEESVAVVIKHFDQLLDGNQLEVRYTVTGVHDTPYCTSAFYQILGPFTLSIEIDKISSIETARKASQYCLSGDGINGYTVGTLNKQQDQPPLTFNTLDQSGMPIDPASFGSELLLNGASNFDPPLNKVNTLVLQNSATGNTLAECFLNLQTITPVSLPTGWRQINSYLCGPGANLAGCDLSNQDLTACNLSNSNLSGTDLSGSNLSFADLSGANLTVFSDSVTSHQTNLTGTNLTGANLSGITSYNVAGSPAALPANWQLIDHTLLGPEVNLANMSIQPGTARSIRIDFSHQKFTTADLRGANLTGDIRVYNTAKGKRENITYAISLDQAELSGANLSYVSSGGIDGTPASLPTNWQLINGYLIGPNADLSGADLSQQDLSSANMADTSLTGANLEQTKFSTATVLDYVTSGGITGAPSLPSGWCLANGYLVGPKSNLINADLSYQHLANDLSNAQLISADLSGADLSGTTLTGVVSANIVADPLPKLPSGWKLENGRLVGP